MKAHNTLQGLSIMNIEHQELPNPDTTSNEPGQEPAAGRGWALPVGLALGAAAAGALWAMRRPGIPADVEPVTDWSPQRFMGHWYEVARIERGHERGLIRTQAEYTLLPDNTIHVLNRGYDPRLQRWKSATGKARFMDNPQVAALKVSFFGPFHGGFNVVALDSDYRWALVIGSSVDSCWILSRTPDLPEPVAKRLLRQASLAGVQVDRLAWVHQDGVSW